MNLDTVTVSATSSSTWLNEGQFQSCEEMNNSYDDAIFD